MIYNTDVTITDDKGQCQCITYSVEIEGDDTRKARHRATTKAIAAAMRKTEVDVERIEVYVYAVSPVQQALMTY